MAMLGQLVAGFAHELNNPVAAILRGTETLSSHIGHLIEGEEPAPTEQLGAQLLQKPCRLSQSPLLKSVTKPNS